MITINSRHTEINAGYVASARYECSRRSRHRAGHGICTLSERRYPQVRSRLNGVAVANAYINESFGTRTDIYQPNTWPNGNALASQTPNGQFYDKVCAFNDGTLSPTAQPPQLGNTGIYRREQTWKTGTLTIGQGKFVQGDDLYLYRDHGAHSNIH